MKWIRVGDVENTYDVIGAFEELGTIDWTKKKYTISKGDTVYIYVGNPYKKIMYKCIVIDDNVDSANVIDDSKFNINSQKSKIVLKHNSGETYVRLKKLEFIDDERLSLHILNRKGLIHGNIQGAYKSENNEKLFDYIEMIEDSILKDEIDDIYEDAKNIDNKKYKEQYIKSRIGQGKFRTKLILKYGCRCMICGISNKDLLIASHIKEFAECQNGEHIDVSNGLLLCANHDKLFDKHLITFDKLGKIQISKMITLDDYNKLNIGNETEIDNRYYNDQYMEFHRKKLR